MTSSFVPSLPTPPSIHEQQDSLPSSSLAPPTTSSSSITPLANQDGPSTNPGLVHSDGLSPNTPNPFPTVEEGELQYATSAGVTVWEGPVGLQNHEETESHDSNIPHDANDSSLSSESRKLLRTKEGWMVVWPGEVSVCELIASDLSFFN